MHEVYCDLTRQDSGFSPLTGEFAVNGLPESFSKLYWVMSPKIEEGLKSGFKEYSEAVNNLDCHVAEIDELGTEGDLSLSPPLLFFSCAIY